MDPRDSPSYRLHRALSNLDSIDVERLETDDRERIAAATSLLEETSFLTKPPSTEETDLRVEP